MSNKDIIAKILDNVSDEQLEHILSELYNNNPESEQTDETRHVIKRRGSGHSKKNKKSKKTNSKTKSMSLQKGAGCRVEPMDIKSHRENKFEEFIDNISLDAQETKELSQAYKDDESFRQVKKNKSNQKRPSTLIEVRCSSCGKDHTVSRFVVQSIDRWKCNSCCCSGR